MGLDTINFNIYLPANTEHTPSLRAEKVSSDQAEILTKVALNWAKAAKERAWSAKVDKEKYRLSSCETISEIIASRLKRYAHYGFSGEEAYVCKDLTDQPQALAIVSKRENDLYLEYLVTNPLNIASSDRSRETERVKGAGSCLLKEAEKRAMDLGKRTVSLSPLDSAITFYEKHGYAFHHPWEMSKEVTKVAEFANATLAA